MELHWTRIWFSFLLFYLVKFYVNSGCLTQLQFNWFDKDNIWGQRLTKNELIGGSFWRSVEIVLNGSCFLRSVSCLGFFDGVGFGLILEGWKISTILKLFLWYASSSMSQPVIWPLGQNLFRVEWSVLMNTKSL